MYWCTLHVHQPLLTILLISFIRLLEYISLFLKAATFIGAPVGTLLQEIFSGGPSISLKVKEEVIVRMMHLVFVKEESDLSSASLLDHEGRAAMVMALQELVQVYLNLPTVYIEVYM